MGHSQRFCVKFFTQFEFFHKPLLDTVGVFWYSRRIIGKGLLDRVPETRDDAEVAQE